MIATTAKLRELAARTWSPESFDDLSSVDFATLALAPALARLVLTLTEALELGGEHDGPCDNVGVPWHKEIPCSLHIAKDVERKAAALAAVETLEL